MFRLLTRRTREDAAARAFVAAMRRSAFCCDACADTAAAWADAAAEAARTDTVTLPRIVATQATPPGGWAAARRDLSVALYRQAVAR